MKMWLSIAAALVVIFSQISSASVIHNQGSADFRSHFQNHAEFGESIKRWFSNIKDRILGRPAVPDTRELFDLSHADLLQRVDDPKSFFLDLSRLTFDPDYDWGFHIGPWYFIRRGDRNIYYGNDNFNDWHFAENSGEFDVTSESVEKATEKPETSTVEPEVPESESPVEDTIQGEEQDNETGSASIYTKSLESAR